MVYRSLFFVLSVALLTQCRSDQTVDPLAVEATTDGVVNMIVEIPAGTNRKIEFDYASGSFAVDQKNGQDRIIDFLPYPGNYGFVPGTLMDKERGGDGDALDILVLGEAQSTGSLIPVRLLGALVLRDKGEIDTKLIAIPADDGQSVIEAENFLEFATKYGAALRIIEDWFQNYKGHGVMEFIRWEDDAYAREEVERWRK